MITFTILSAVVVVTLDAIEVDLCAVFALASFAIRKVGTVDTHIANSYALIFSIEVAYLTVRIIVCARFAVSVRHIYILAISAR